MRKGMEKLPEGMENLGEYLVILRARDTPEDPWDYISCCYEVEILSHSVNDTIGVWSWDWDECQEDVEILEVISGRKLCETWQRICGPY